MKVYRPFFKYLSRFDIGDVLELYNDSMVGLRGERLMRKYNIREIMEKQMDSDGVIHLTEEQNDYLNSFKKQDKIDNYNTNIKFIGVTLFMLIPFCMLILWGFSELVKEILMLVLK